MPTPCLRWKVTMWPNHALQRTRPLHHCSNRRVSWAGSLSLGRWSMRVLFALGACVLLSGCSPLVDAQIHNATGRSIVVTNLGQPGFHASIPPGGSAAVDIFVMRAGYPADFSVTSGSRVWIYRTHSRFLASVSRQYWEHGPLESQRLHVSVDSRGRIYLLSPSSAPLNQPVGFPIHPDEQKKT